MKIVKTRPSLFLQLDRSLTPFQLDSAQCKLIYIPLLSAIVSDRQLLTLKLPYFSLALLFCTYTIFGWLLHAWTYNRAYWLAAAFGIVILGGFIAYPSRSVSMSFGRFFKTDTRAFILIVITSIASVVLVTWLQFFVDVIVLCTAGLLVSLDLKIRAWSKPTALLVIIGWQLLGMSFGLFLYDFSIHPPTNLPDFLYSVYWNDKFSELMQQFQR